MLNMDGSVGVALPSSFSLQAEVNPQYAALWLLPPCRGKVGMGVECLTNANAIRALHPHPNLPTTRGKGLERHIIVGITHIFRGRQFLQPSLVIIRARFVRALPGVARRLVTFLVSPRKVTQRRR